MISRRQFLLLASSVLAPSKVDAVVLPTGLTVPELRRKTFLVPKVDKEGVIISQEERSTSFYLEDLGEGVTLQMVLIPAGTFLMGSSQKPEEQPIHSVTVRPFFLGAYEITRGQWRRAMTFPQVHYRLGNLVRLKMAQDVENSLPVDLISFFQAEEFCARLSKVTGRSYRLPSEAEWEYACRAGTSTAYHFGDAISLEVANYGDEKRPRKMPVGSRNAPNAFGLHDMHGNVLEWCSDWAHPNYEGAPTDGSAWVSGRDARGNVSRGGMYSWNADTARSAARALWSGPVAFSGSGFRVALGPYLG